MLLCCARKWSSSSSSVACLSQDDYGQMAIFPQPQFPSCKKGGNRKQLNIVLNKKFAANFKQNEFKG